MPEISGAFNVVVVIENDDKTLEEMNCEEGLEDVLVWVGWVWVKQREF